MEEWLLFWDSVFLWIFSISFGLLIVMFLLGGIAEIFDHVFHGVFGAFEAIFSHGGHDIDFGHIDHAGDHDDSGVGVINVRTILGFLTFFGGGGLLLIRSNTPWWVALPGAFFCGILAGWVVWQITKAIYHQGGSSHIRASECIGVPGVVTLRIEPNSPGEVRITVRGEHLTGRAKSSHGGEIPPGTRVAVLDKEGGMYIVEELGID